jgi:hypothetical protein
MPKPTLDRQLAESAMEAIASHPGVRLDVDAQTVMCVVAGLQLALRHPGYPPNSRAIVEGFARALQERLATSGPLAVIMEMGWNPDFDVTGAEFADEEHREDIAARVFRDAERKEG